MHSTSVFSTECSRSLLGAATAATTIEDFFILVCCFLFLFSCDHGIFLTPSGEVFQIAIERYPPDHTAASNDRDPVGGSHAGGVATSPGVLLSPP